MNRHLLGDAIRKTNGMVLKRYKQELAQPLNEEKHKILVLIHVYELFKQDCQ